MNEIVGGCGIVESGQSPLSVACIAAIDDDMGKTKRAILAVAGLAGQAIALHDPQEPPVWILDRETDAAARLGHRRHGRHDRA